ncbi:hypothetical protein [uncultured Ruminococcus sp.]|uniref:hypothetical protein n=1 Tax=uncultured Ruminococcus sp. TaxID=165186 RepID=UPI0025F1CC46|nr:hypothetical protein [uncultured Ruminococcus sp.]
MKTSSRKRLLVSSVAMLLVAMLALGTATYAWFTSSTAVYADGISIRTTKASKLEISKSDGKWGNHVDYGVSKIMYPISSANGTAWFKADAAKDTEFTAKAGTFASQTDLGDYVIKNQLNVRNNGEQPVENVKIKFTFPSNSDYLRVALVETSGIGASVSDTGTFATSIYDNNGTPYQAVSAATPTFTEISPKTTTEITVGSGTLTKGQAKYYNLYIWFEGQDEQCIDTNAGQTLGSWQFEVTGDTVKETN